MGFGLSGSHFSSRTDMTRFCASFRRLIVLTLFIGVVGMTAGCSSGAVSVPEPRDGTRYYEVSEICQHIGNEGYGIKGTVQHPVGVADLVAILDRLPASDRSMAEHIIIGVGIEVEVDLKGLCKEWMVDTLLGEKG